MILILLETGQNYLIPLTNNDIKKNIDFRLSVQITLTGLSFLVLNTDTQDVVFFSEKKQDSILSPEEILLNIKSVFSENESVIKKCNEVLVIYATELYTLVPTLLFDESKSSEYLKFNSKILSNDFVANDTVNNQNITVVYIPFTNINNYFFDEFGDFTYYHSTTLLLKLLLTKEKHSQTTKVFVHINQSHFDLIVIKKGNLLLCNSYNFKTPEDFIYYILFCFEQLKLNPDLIETVLCGAITEGDLLYKIAYKYIRNIIFYTEIESKIKCIETDKDHNNLLLKNSI